MEYHLVVIKVEKRESDAAQVQKLLTDFGCNIKVRLGLHDIPSDVCSPSGLIILEVVAEQPLIDDFLKQINQLQSVTAKQLVI